MTQARVHLEEVSWAVRQGFLLAVAATLVITLGLLAVGLGPAPALLAGALVMAVGAASGGFGLAARVALPARKPHQVPEAPAAHPVAALQVPQTR